MKVAIDTSVIVAGLVEAHPNHARAIWWFGEQHGLERFASWHAYAEAWAVLTVLPIEPRVPAEVATAVLERLRSIVEFVPPSSRTYPLAASRCSGRGQRSGAIYDALHLVNAEEAKADIMLTFNVADFARLSEPDGPRVVAPPDPPGMP